MSKLRKLYWDTTCFICFLNRKEDDRRLICQDVLLHAQRKEIEIWTSMFTIAEVIRPRRMQPVIPNLPDWATRPLTSKDPELQKLFKGEENQIKEVWEYYHRNTAPYERLTKDQINNIAGMFEWKFIQKVLVDERTAKKAVELSRDYDLKPADAIHAASAILKRVDALQRWDKDFDKVKSLIAVEEPVRLSAQNELIPDFRRLGPHPEDFEPKAPG
ncbi:MAG TPA: PIN domain-containing protein [Terriglobales bacterium]|nr:PIN domain-containing protein [Terriglobales bacterium]